MRRLLPWVIGAALLGAVIAAAVHYSEAREFGRLLDEARPWYVALAFVLQALTYVAQGEVFRGAPRAAGMTLPRRWLVELSVGKLFLDQALPSAGLSSMVLVSTALRARGVPAAAVAATAMINIASYHAAYVVALVVALAIMVASGQTNIVIAIASALFALYGVALTVFILAIAGRQTRVSAWLARHRSGAAIARSLEDADRLMVRSPRLLGVAVGWQLAIFVLDAATMWVLLQSLAAPAGAGGVFACFMVSSLFRTVGIVPGGLGTYEATSVVTLKLIGVPLPAALAATLLFRGLSFWLPMLPGLWCSRHVLRPAHGRAFSAAGAYWARDPAAVAAEIGASLEGLAQVDAEDRLRRLGPNRLGGSDSRSRGRILAAQLRSPLLLLLVFAATTSAFMGEWTDAAIVYAILIVSTGITYSREYSAHNAVAALQARVRTVTTVVRGGRPSKVPVEDVVVGDVVLLSAGSLVPADAVVLEATNCFLSEAVLTGESFPVEKRAGIAAPDAPLGARTNCVFMGTNVRSGTARCLVVATGTATAFGAVAGRLALDSPETEFDRGLRQFGYLLAGAMFVLVFLVFVVQMLRGMPPVDTLLFSVALAVGLSPELLPAILSVNLARGARTMARRGVIVRRLSAIENLGSMDVLCTDKTGTLTEGVVRLEGAYDPSGVRSPAVLRLAVLNAGLETGLSNPLDEAILQGRDPDLAGVRKVAEIPFDFVRKRVSVIVQTGGAIELIAKGAFDRVLDVCTRTAAGHVLDTAAKAQLAQQYSAWTVQGIRVLAVATRVLEPGAGCTRDDERDLIFAGFLTFLDQPKPGVAKTIAGLGALGVSIKIITGDSRLVAQHVARLVGLDADRLLTGAELNALNDEALWNLAERTVIFAEVDPNQKERIILSLKKMGHVVGFLGDGVNDAPAMHAADTSLSVEQAVDVAREAADFVLLERDLDVIRGGIESGRATFANTLKYVLTTMSANLGNMISMAAASMFLPFLPLLAGQILLNNFLSDIPAIGLADDSVDPELVARPERWRIGYIGRFMAEFGVLSSAFDALAFGALLVVFHAMPELFRTAWFVESLLTELVIALIVRTRRPFYRSRPGALLLWSTLALVGVALAIPYLPFVSVLGLVPLPAAVVATMCGLTVAYVAATEVLKRWFFRLPLRITLSAPFAEVRPSSGTSC